MGGGERSGGNGKREEGGERRKEERGTGLIVGGHVIEFAGGKHNQKISMPGLKSNCIST